MGMGVGDFESLTAEPSSLQIPEYALRVPPMPCEKITTGNGSCPSKIGACCMQIYPLQSFILNQGFFSGKLSILERLKHSDTNQSRMSTGQ